MGYYINNIGGIKLGPSFDEKRKQLVAFGALPVVPVRATPNLVCLVDNGYFAALAYIYSQRELEEFKLYDGRQKLFFILDHAAELSGYTKHNS